MLWLILLKLCYGTIKKSQIDYRRQFGSLDYQNTIESKLSIVCDKIYKNRVEMMV